MADQEKHEQQATSPEEQEALRGAKRAAEGAKPDPEVAPTPVGKAE